MYRLIIKRQKAKDELGYIQKFLYQPTNELETIASALIAINAQEKILDEEGKESTPIEWECSCLQKKCGACAMVINGMPRLACDAFLSEFKSKTDIVDIKIEPLRKFPVIRDLIVDRAILFENLKILKAWLTDEAFMKDKRRELNYQASECLQCGCCLDVCPNFYVGGSFYGPAAVPIMTRLLSETDLKDRKELAKLYSQHEFEGCGKSLSCQKICPKNIDTQNLIVNAIALSIWKIK